MGEAATSAWRPTGRSGRVTTRGTSKPPSSRAASAGTANSGVPKKTTLTATRDGAPSAGLLRGRLGLGRRRFRGPQRPEPRARDAPDRRERDEREPVDEREDDP